MKARILELSHKHKLGHLSSNLTTADVIQTIANEFRSDRDKMCDAPPNQIPLILVSCGHAGLALYAAMEKFLDYDAEKLLEEHGAQPHLCYKTSIPCTTGSLGQGLTVAVGYAIARRDQDIHCIISDGECAEGCVWEALAFARLHHLNNLIVHVNMNGYSALGPVDTSYLSERLRAFLPSVRIHLTNGEQYPFLRGIHAHYKTMSDSEYESTRNFGTYAS